MNRGEDIKFNREGKLTDEEKKAQEQLQKAKEQLQQAESVWEDDNFIRALAEKGDKERNEAFQLKLEIGTKILAIENAQIKLITSRVEENAQQLKSAIESLNQALQRLTNVTRILKATEDLLSIVTRILTLL